MLISIAFLLSTASSSSDLDTGVFSPFLFYVLFGVLVAPRVVIVRCTCNSGTSTVLVLTSIQTCLYRVN